MHRRTRGVGPSPCAFLLTSDYPGRVEAQTGIPLTGRTGDEVNHYLDGIKLPVRDDIFINNLIRVWNPDNEYTLSDVTRDKGDLLDDLRAVQPQLIITLGRWSARYFLGDVDLDEVQGLPWYLPHASEAWACFDQTQRPVVFPLYNPAAGFRSPDVQAFVAHGFKELALYLDDKIEPRELFKDPYPTPTYLEVTDPKWLAGALRGVRDINVDSEGTPARVWSWQFSVQAGTAYLLRTDTVLTAFVQALERENPVVTFHGSLHDFGIFRVTLQRLGLPVELLYGWQFDDTQIMAYLLQLEPRGLKPNWVRHCNMVMQSYTDVLGDAQLRLSQDYLVRVFHAEHATYVQRQRDEFARINASPLLDAQGNPKRNKDGTVRTRRTTVLPSLPKSDLHKAALRVLASKDPLTLSH